MDVDSYKGKERMFIGFAIGMVVTLLFLTFTSDSGFYSFYYLLKYSLLGGLAAGFINFVYYDQTYISPEELELEKDQSKNIENHSSPSYDNYIDSSGGGDSGGGGD